MIENICTDEIHNEFINHNEMICPLCNNRLIDCDNTYDICCDESNVLEIDGIRICVKCGKLHESI